MRIIQLDPTASDATDVVRSLQFHPDGKGFAATLGPRRAVYAVLWSSLAYDHEVKRLSVEDGGDGEEFAEERDEYPDPAISSDLELVAWASLDSGDDREGIRLLDVRARPWQEVWAYSQTSMAAYHCTGFDPAGKAVYAGGLDEATNTAHVFRWDIEALFDLDPYDEDAADAELPPLILASQEIPPTCLGFSPDGRVMAVGFDHGNVALFDLTKSNPKPRTLTRGHGPAVLGLTISPDGSAVAVRSGGRLAVYSQAGARLDDPAGTAEVTGAAYSPDGRTLAVADAGGSVTFFDPVTFAVRRRFEWGVGGLHGVAFAPDGLTCAAGGEQGRVVLWDVDE